MIVRATKRWSAALPLVLLVLATLGACSGSGSGGSHSSAAPTSGSSASADPATVAAITQAYATFFAPDSTAAQVQSVVQNGAMFASTINSEGNSQYSGKSGVKVSAVMLQSDDVAKLTFSVTVNNAVLLPNAIGYAIRDGTWKMAAATFCQLLTLEGTAPTLCSQPGATALPTP